MTRDYAADMRALIDSEATGSYSAPVKAAEIVEKLRATDPDLLTGWLDVQAVTFVREAINARDASVRTHNRPRSNPDYPGQPVPTSPKGQTS